MYFKTQGLVVRKTAYQDSDEILTVLTMDRGLVSMKAARVRTNSSPLKAACQLLTYSEFTVFENRGYVSVKEAAPLEMFQKLRDDIELLALGSYFAQAAEVLSQNDTPEESLLRLTLNALYALSLGRDPATVKAAFELRSVSDAGYSPALEGCDTCGSPEPSRFLVSGGTLQCAACGGSGLRLPVSPASIAAMRYIVSCDLKRLFSFRLEPEPLHELADVSETYLLTQLERGFSTLDFYKQLKLL